MKLLLNAKPVDASVHNQWALRSAAERGHASVVRLLIQRAGADPSAQNSWALRIASELGYKGMVGAVAWVMNDLFYIHSHYLSGGIKVWLKRWHGSFIHTTVTTARIHTRFALHTHVFSVFDRAL